jgi:arginyl-tRNA synthetase
MFERLALEATTLLRPVLGDQVSVDFSRPQDSAHGDLATAVALRLSKEMKKPPREIAQQIADVLGGLKGVAKAEVAGAGYVNLWLKPEALLEELKLTREACNPKKVKAKAKPVIVEYSQPNIAKPLAIHHIIGTVLGQALVNLYRHEGANVIAWNYLGDWGTQFGKLSVAFEKWGTKPAKDCTLDELLSFYVKFHQEVENDASLEDAGREASRRLEAGDEKLRAFWKEVVHVTKSSLASIYDRLNVSFDTDLGESFYEDKMQPVLEEGMKKGVFTEGEGGALIAQFGEDMPPYLVRRGDGGTLYSTRDLAQMRYRIDTFHPEAIYILTDIAQKLHFEQLVATCKQLGWELPEFENVLFGRMRFVDKSMSTRKGNVLALEHVLDEAVARAEEIIKERGEAIQTDNPQDLAEMMGVGSLVYGILSQSRKSDLVFDWEKMLSFEGNSAPYIQYTHARAKSVLRKAEMKGESAFPKIEILSERERALIQTLLQFPQVLEESRREHLPHKLTNFLHSLCQEFNAFYNSEPILQAPDPQKGLRVALTSLTATVLKTGAELLTLRVPERM